MGKNTYENFVFSVMICFLMVLGMTVYNSLLLSTGAIGILKTLTSVQFIAIFFVALFIDWFFVAPIVKKIVSKLTNEETPFIKKVMLISGFMVLMMCASMSLVATLVQGYQGSLFVAYGKAFVLNIIMALPLQFVIAGPIARTAFFKMYPPATTMA